MRNYTETDYVNLGRQAGFIWLGPTLPESMLERTAWKCEKEGHTFQMRGANVYLAVRNPGSRGCPFCSHRWRRTGVDYHHLAKLHGIEWVGGSAPSSTRDVTRWRLPTGETLERSYRTVAQRVSQLGNPALRVEGR